MVDEDRTDRLPRNAGEIGRMLAGLLEWSARSRKSKPIPYPLSTSD